MTAEPVLAVGTPGVADTPSGRTTKASVAEEGGGPAQPSETLRLVRRRGLDEALGIRGLQGVHQLLTRVGVAVVNCRGGLFGIDGAQQISGLFGAQPREQLGQTSSVQAAEPRACCRQLCDVSSARREVQVLPVHCNG